MRNHDQETSTTPNQHFTSQIEHLTPAQMQWLNFALSPEETATSVLHLSSVLSRLLGRPDVTEEDLEAIGWVQHMISVCAEVNLGHCQTNEKG